MRKALSAAVLVLGTLVVTGAYATEVEEHHSSSYDSKTVESQPEVRERTTVETVPPAQRDSETIVREGDKHHDGDEKVETKSKTKVEHDD